MAGGRQGGKQKPLKAPKAPKKEYDETDLENQKKKKEDEKALKELRAKAAHLWYRKAISIRNTVK